MNPLQLRGVIGGTRTSGQAKMSSRRERLSNSPNDSTSRNHSIVAPGGTTRDLYNSRFQTSIESTYREHRPTKNSNSPGSSGKKSSPRDLLKGDSMLTHSYMRYSQ